MQLRVSEPHFPLPQRTRILLPRMLGPLCGMDRTVGFLLRSPFEPRLAIAGADMTGVHVVRGEAEPGAYHLGGAGVLLDEAVIRSLGETVERYSQFVSVLGGRHRLRWASHEEMVAAGRPVVAAERLRFYAPEQHARPGFRFRPLDASTPLSWVACSALPGGEERWVPAQLALVGYLVRHADGEPWLYPGMTTGSAAHTSRARALRNALLELIQIDSAMGHWYSAATAPRIGFDARTTTLERLLRKVLPAQRDLPELYFLANADLPGLTVACVVREPAGKRPAVAVGLGIDLALERALYKAVLEAVGVTQLAKVDLVNRAISARAGGGEAIDPGSIYDLDSNVTWYADPENAPRLQRKFSAHDVVPASELPADVELGPRAEVELLVDGFRSSGKELVGLDLTLEDMAALGFVAVRAWSPDTLSLSFPSAPPEAHPRFAAYGGVAHRDPHPYP